MIQHSENIQRAEEKVIDMTLLILSFSFTEIRGPSPPPPPPPRWFKERLLCLMYTVLIAKSLAYFCGLSLLGITRKKGRSTNSTPANWLSLNSFYVSITSVKTIYTWWIYATDRLEMFTLSNTLHLSDIFLQNECDLL